MFASRRDKVNIISFIILAGFTASVIFHYIQGAYWLFGYPLNTFLFDPVDRFNDYFHPYERSIDRNFYFHPNYPSNYCPFANIIFYFLTFLAPSNGLILCSAVFVSSFIYLNVMNAGAEDTVGSLVNVFIFSFLTYPFLYLIDRGQSEGWVFICLAFFIHFFNKKRFMVSSVLLSFAIAMKLSPVVFLVFMLSEKKYRETIFTIALVFLLTAGSLLLHKGGLSNNINYVLSGCGVMQNSVYFLVKNNVVQRGVNLNAFIKIILIETNLINSINMAIVSSVFSMVSLLLSVGVSLYVILIEKEQWKRVALLIFIMLLFPLISGDHRLLHIFIPLYLFINSKEHTKLDLFYAIMFALLLIPKDYYVFPNIISDSLLSDTSISVVFNVLLLIVMTLVIIGTGISRWRKIGTDISYVEAGRSARFNSDHG